MKTKQLLCLLVLTVSGNTLGSAPMPGTQTPINITDMATNHFAPLAQGLSMQDSAMVQMSEICKMLNTELMGKCMKCMQDAYQEGVKAGLMAAGTHMQAGMTAMGNIVSTMPKKK